MRVTSVARGPLVSVLALAIGSGCLANTYRIPSNELARLAATPPAQRGAALRVKQEWDGADAPPAATPVGPEVRVGFVGTIDIHGGGGPGGGPRPGAGGGGPHGGGGVAPPAPKPGGGGGLTGGSEAADAKAVAVAIVALAVAGVVVGAASAGSRFDGTVTTHPMHPVHLFLRDGQYLVAPLAHLDPAMVAATERAVLRPSEGPLRRLGRDPLERTGLTYSVLGGASTSVSADGRLGVGSMWHLQLGYFPSHLLGVVADVALSWRDNQVGATLFDNRYGLEAQLFPVAAGRLHAGVYAGAGLGGRFEDALPGGDDSGTLLSTGAQLQLDWTTHLAVTARTGVTAGYGELMREAAIGLAIY
ncbi:MAG: hypothetical protein KA297_29335 [Kofleriaceae bacterium]|jgi:hypothetical protein|nr:hypothetical protein [Kofleriaceae bacterium]MBP6840240.1 hypothetical protein [Kofleriaceae bacterium]